MKIYVPLDEVLELIAHGFCREEEVTDKCDCCGQEFPVNELHALADGLHVCKKCREAECFSCAKCGRVFMSYEAESFEGELMCPECASGFAVWQMPKTFKFVRQMSNQILNGGTKI